MVKDTIFEYNHETSEFSKALGVSDYTDTICREIIYFSSISNYLLGRELYDNVDDIPKSLTTCTGDLQKSLKLIRNEQEKNYLLLIFNKSHDLALDSIAKYRAYNNGDESERKKMEILMKLAELKFLEEDEEGVKFIKPTEMMNRIDYVKQSNYKFERYMTILCENNKQIAQLLERNES